MAYCAEANITARIPSLNLAQLTNDNPNSTRVNSTVLTALIAAADAEIDSHLSERYTVPFTSTPSRIRDLSVTLTIYHAMARRFSVMGVAREWKDAYTAAISELKALAAGELALPGVTVTESDECAITDHGREIDFDDTDNQASYF